MPAPASGRRRCAFSAELLLELVRRALVRAALEAMAFSSADLLDAMAGPSGLEVPVLRVDGGAEANDLLMQFQADVLGVPVERPDMVETTALGAAGLAGHLGARMKIDVALSCLPPTGGAVKKA